MDIIFCFAEMQWYSGESTENARRIFLIKCRSCTVVPRSVSTKDGLLFAFSNKSCKFALRRVFERLKWNKYNVPTIRMPAAALEKKPFGVFTGMHINSKRGTINQIIKLKTIIALVTSVSHRIRNALSSGLFSLAHRKWKIHFLSVE